nr:amidohydrolase family protein [Clostridia bacterium]
MFIDIHAHAYRKPVELPLPFLVKFSTAEEVLKRYDEMGIAMGCLLPIVNPEIYMPQANEDILDMAEQYPDRFIPFCNIDPRILTDSPRSNLTMVLEHYKNKGCKGVGEVMPNLAVMDPLVQNLFMACENVGLPVTFDGSDTLGNGDFGLYDDPGLPQLEHTLQSFPNLKIFGHGPVFWSEIGRLKTPGERSYFYSFRGHFLGRMPSHKIEEEGVVPILFRRYENLHGDLSDCTAFNALARDPEYAWKFIDEFQDRLCFGTDMTAPDMPEDTCATLERWHTEGHISDVAFNKIMRDNAIRIFELDK